ncbi:uncharacterized protein DUF4843 [Sphingobacterium paludis]|uniref:Uncharacterized protein DUF4843 n=2 Tax=Sphingobacterium paludis TaxID=1476465 RepID=A0A4R7CS72_9SPHI|nr:uncharacterized protein DUF4843 [Sphingobacterium paludis]
MLKINYIYILIAFSCCKPDPLVFITNNAYLQFAFRDSLKSTDIAEVYLDSMIYSFGAVPNHIDEAVVAIPIKLIGQPQSQDRRYNVRVQHCCENGLEDGIRISETILRSNSSSDTLFLTVSRSLVHKEDFVNIDLYLDNSEGFTNESVISRHFRCKFTEKLLEPDWWFSWRSKFGQFHQEVYRKWIEIYYPGSDPSDPVGKDKRGYCWYNMPSTTAFNEVPVTFYYIQRLRAYFEQNIVYPDGNINEQRILLPRL